MATQSANVFLQKKSTKSPSYPLIPLSLTPNPPPQGPCIHQKQIFNLSSRQQPTTSTAVLTADFHQQQQRVGENKKYYFGNPSTSSFTLPPPPVPPPDFPTYPPKSSTLPSSIPSISLLTSRLSPSQNLQISPQNSHIFNPSAPPISAASTISYPLQYLQQQSQNQLGLQQNFQNRSPNLSTGNLQNFQQQQQQEQQSSCANHMDYLSWLRQVQQHQRQEDNEMERRVGKPWWLWWIAYIDLFSAISYAVLLVYFLFTQPISDPDSFIWVFFISCIDVLLILLMGFGLLTGLRSEEDASTLWYCKLWVACQLIFLVASVIQFFRSILLHTADSQSFRGGPPPPLVVITIFVYRIITFFMVRNYTRKLRKSVKRREELEDAILCAEVRQHGEREEDQTFGTGESSYCIPSAALILSL